MTSSTGKKTVPVAQIELLNKINKVEGFDPEAFTTEYTDLNSNETRKHLPVMAQMAWFRLKYPEGKIAVSIETGNNCFVATARIYPSYKDPADSYLSEATASRGPDPSKPTVSAREWAQTAAVGIALRNAGFGLQFGAAGDEFTSQLPNEFPGAAPVVLPPVNEDEPVVMTPQPDVIHHLTGDTVLAVPGVNSLNHLEEALYFLREHGTSHIMTAFDMDYLTNPNVDSGYARLREMLSRVGMQYGTYLWDPQYKGLDDYIWQHCFRSNRG